MVVRRGLFSRGEQACENHRGDGGGAGGGDGEAGVQGGVLAAAYWLNK